MLPQKTAARSQFENRSISRGEGRCDLVVPFLVDFPQKRLLPNDLSPKKCCPRIIQVHAAGQRVCEQRSCELHCSFAAPFCGFVIAYTKSREWPYVVDRPTLYRTYPQL